MCGIVGVFGVEDSAEQIYLGLHALQHRGQEQCGIVSRSSRKFYGKHKDGLVCQSFSEKDLKELKGDSAIGHVRYSTQGESTIGNAQPFYVDGMALAHNGEIANHEAVRRALKEEGSVFRTGSDSEVIIHKFFRSGGNLEEKIRQTFQGIKPSYSVIILTENEMVGIRDPSGVRPLEIGVFENDEGFVLASESVALDKVGAKLIGEVGRGEAVIIDKNGLRRKQIFEPEENLPCVFCHVYLGHPCSKQFNAEVSNSIIREEFGRILWRESPADADVVISVPDSGNALAKGYSKESGIQMEFGVIRSHYVGRTFIEPTQSRRKASVLRKFDFDSSILNGKRIALIDDSVVRGTTLKRLIGSLREFGAREVHARIGSPPYKHGCYLGIDTPNKKHLIAYKSSEAEIAREVGADSIGFLSKEGMLENKYLKNGSYCTFCFDGEERIVRG